VKLLRAIQEREILPLGATEPHRIDVRWIAATNRDLAPLVEKEEFREDLYFRLNVVPLSVPPLRERPGDVPLLVEHFLRRKRTGAVGRSARFSPEALRILESYPWPGNVRELENVVERVLALAEGSRVEAKDLPREIRELGHSSGFPSYEEARERFEKRYLFDLLQRAGGVVTRAAEAAGLSRQSLHAKIRAHGIDLEPFRR
jgi:two-component system response regulator AtoC